MPTSTINGVKLFWELTGDSGEPLVLVHGSWINHHSWDLVLPSLSQFFRVLTYDRRGHSQSERPTSPGNIQEDVADLAALIEELDLAPAHIVGHSLGGSIVLRLAIERPDLFRSMLINEPPLFDLLTDEPGGQAMFKAIDERITAVVKLLEAGDMEAGARQFVDTIAFGPGTWEKLPIEMRQEATSNAPTFLDEVHDPQVFKIELDRLRNFHQPVLLMLGEYGPPFFRPIIEKIAKRLPQAQRKVFAGADHEPEQSNPIAYASTITEFITRTMNSSA